MDDIDAGKLRWKLIILYTFHFLNTRSLSHLWSVATVQACSRRTREASKGRGSTDELASLHLDFNPSATLLQSKGHTNGRRQLPDHRRRIPSPVRRPFNRLNPLPPFVAYAF